MEVTQSLPDLGVPASRGELLASPDTAILRDLGDLAARSPRPLVVLFDVACMPTWTSTSGIRCSAWRIA